jgi:hypothetical protein
MRPIKEHNGSRVLGDKIMDNITYYEVTIIAGMICFFMLWKIIDLAGNIKKDTDRINEQLNNLRKYLYEIDPQFDDERASEERFGMHMQQSDSSDIFAGMDDMELLREKHEKGMRTLHRTFLDNDLETMKTERDQIRRAVNEDKQSDDI